MADPELVRKLVSSGFLPPDELSRAPVWELGRYVVSHGLGKGASSEVFLARDPLLGREVAIKLLKAVADPTRFHQEMKLLAALEHPNVVKIFDGGLHEGRPYFVMEYLGAHTLESTELDLARAVKLLEQVAAACHHAHQRGVVHRDLKPANILVAEDDRAVVADFGIAKLVDRPGHTLPGMIVGTLAYMAPEQLAGGDQVGPAVDVYALGAILYERLCGRLPHEAESVEAFLGKLASGAPIQPPSELAEGVPPALEAAALRALAHEPADRFGSAAELADALATWRRGGRPGAVGAAVAAPAGPEVARLVAVIGLPLLLAVIGLAIALGGRAPRSERAASPTANASASAAPNAAAPTPASPPPVSATASPRPSPSRAFPSPAPSAAAAEIRRGVELLRSVDRTPERELPRLVSDAVVAVANGVALGARDATSQQLLARCCRLVGPFVVFDAVDAEGRKVLARELDEALPALSGDTPLLRAARAAVTALRDFCAGRPPSPGVAATLRDLTERRPGQLEPWLSTALFHLLALKHALPKWNEAAWIGLGRCRAAAERIDPLAPELVGLNKSYQGLSTLRAKLRGGK